MDKQMEGISKFLKDFPKEFNENIIPRSINSTLKIARVRAIDNVCKTYFINKKFVIKEINIEKARKGDSNGYLKSIGTVNNIEKFKVKHTGDSIFVAVRKDIGFQQRDKSFSNVIKKFSGNSGSKNGKRSNPTFSDEKKRFGLRRSSKSRYPIQRLTGPAVPSMLSSKNVVEPLEESINIELVNVLETEILKKFKK